MEKEKATGMVIILPLVVWFEIEQRVLDQRIIGIKTNKAKEAARLIRIGLATEKKEDVAH